jgi:hypothetical protein
MIELLYIYAWKQNVKNSKKNRWGIRKSNRGGEFDQSTLYACMEMSQQNPLVQLIYANKKERKRKAARKKYLGNISLTFIHLTCNNYI